MEEDSFEVEEWDADFLDQVLQAEELALSTQRSRQTTSLPPPPPPRRAPPCEVSYSPPRELSQRTHEIQQADCTPDVPASFDIIASHSVREQENDMLKRELQGVSKHLYQLEHEILELRKEKEKKEEELKDLQSKVEAKDGEYQTTNCVKMPTAPGISIEYQNAKPSNNKLSSSCIRSSEKLFRLWNSDDQKKGNVLVSKIFRTCEADFHMLFEYVNSPQNSNKATQPIETAKVSELYSVLSKLQISNDTSRLRELLRALADLCNLKNVAIVRGSVHILYHVLSNSFSLEKECGKSRENVILEEHLHTDSDANRSEDPESESLCFENIAEILKQGQNVSELHISNNRTLGRSGFFDPSFGTSISEAFWVALFETMCAVASENNEKQIRREVLSIMNLILMRQNAYLVRDKFAGEHVFHCLSKLLRKEAGFSVQDQAVRTLYLLCNSPKVVALLCSDFEEGGAALAISDDITNQSGSSCKRLKEILIGLADCVACCRSACAEEMKLRRNAISVLAFLGSTGKYGLEIILNHSLPKGTNFLVVILQSLASDLDSDALTSVKQSGTVKEQCLLIRETLIFLNRLVSHPDYSIPVLRALTNTREIATTTVDIATRLTWNHDILWRDISSRKHARESEIIDLARVFKKRVFTFLGDNIS